MVHYRNTMTQKLLVVGAFLVQHDHVLLALRQDNAQYGLIGGKVDNHESIDQALMREIFEEIGVIVTPEHMKLIQVISFMNAGIEMVSFDFMINTWNGEWYNKEPNKHTHIDWFPLHNLPSTILERHKLALDRYRNGIYYSTMGYLP